MIPEQTSGNTFDDVISAVRESPETTIVIVLLSAENTRSLLQAATRANLTGEVTWVAGSAWGTSEEVVAGSQAASERAITFKLDYANLPELSDFEEYFTTLPINDTRDPWFGEYLAMQEAFSLDVHTAYVIQAVDSALLGIHEALIDSCDGQLTLCENFTSDVNKWSIIHESIRSLSRDSVRFDQETGEQSNALLSVHRYSPPNAVSDDFYYRQVSASLHSDVINLLYLI